MEIVRPQVQLMDTTLRDGEQTQGVSFTPDEKVSIAKALLQSLNVDRIEVASARVSLGEKHAVSSLMQWAEQEQVADRIEILGFVDHTKSVDWISSSGAKVINLLTKGSEKHCTEQLRKTPSQHIADVRETIYYAIEQGLTVNIYLEDWSNGYSDNPEYVYNMVRELSDLPIQHYMLPDTLGIMSPDEVHTSLSDMIRRFPKLKFDFHPHNDYGLATANALTAAKVGISAIHCTVNCLGERAGNASLAEVAVVLKDKLGIESSINEQRIHQISQMIENFSGKITSANAPIIGADVFTQTSGIHADGDNKGGLYQTVLGPERFERTRTYALGKMSGKASLEKNLEDLNIDLTAEQKTKLLQRIVTLGDQKATITPEDLPFIIADLLESKDYSHIELLNCSITSGLNVDSTASIRVRIGDEMYKSAGSGNGGFDAFSMAIQAIMQKVGFDYPSLENYQVRIPPGGKTSALTESFITWQQDNKTFRTRGVSSNQVFAGVQATMRMLNKLLHEKITA
ncbi:alpha-isopropylmalate synthase regulatory domain-containing protein [Moritella sp.]|uniref:alpha-isopropylmalate synthase regulatory domain-containing protein n=1 Tax=Moritella sp. TaxID=78556 RepID=UPI001D60514D|nr:alpha-isopropylmalate synthase regulatory domain-containing protein [Moritella sp.]MCJ8351363.1 2-isopropylmalate synthase [Moritella sp.]NQZ42457.1 2-isopropylmalate synthase [Moritella sp.]